MAVPLRNSYAADMSIGEIIDHFSDSFINNEKQDDLSSLIATVVAFGITDGLKKKHGIENYTSQQIRTMVYEPLVGDGYGEYRTYEDEEKAWQLILDVIGFEYVSDIVNNASVAIKGFNEVMDDVYRFEAAVLGKWSKRVIATNPFADGQKI